MCYGAIQRQENSEFGKREQGTGNRQQEIGYPARHLTLQLTHITGSTGLDTLLPSAPHNHLTHSIQPPHTLLLFRLFWDSIASKGEIFERFSRRQIYKHAIALFYPLLNLNLIANLGA